MTALSPGLSALPHRIAVIGAGAMGCSLAAALGHSCDVVMIVRDSERANRIRADGVTLRGLSNARARPHVVPRIADLGALGPVDAVFVATKTTAIDAVSNELAPALRQPGVAEAGPFVVSFQNGIESGRWLRDRLAYPYVLRMVVNYGARLHADGAVDLLFSRPPHAIGSPDPRLRRACDALASTLTRGGMETVVAEDIERVAWFKGVMNAAMNPVAALINGGVGEVLDSPARDIVEGLLGEALDVASAEGIRLGSDARARVWARLECARAHTPSMVEDIRDGRPSEVGQLNRQVIEHGARVRIATPTHRLITSLIDAFDWRAFQRTAVAPLPRRQ